MSEINAGKVPRWFWVVSGVALVWNLLGVLGYISEVTLTDVDLASKSDAERALYDDIPIWATSAFAIAVFGGVLGSAALLLRKRWATPLLIASLLGVLVQMFHAFVLTDSLDVYGPTGLIGPIIIIVIACFLVWFARMATARGWLT